MHSIQVRLSAEELRALQGDCQINVRDLKNHIRYLIKFHLIGYQDFKIERLGDRISQIEKLLDRSAPSAQAMLEASERLRSVMDEWVELKAAAAQGVDVKAMREWMPEI